MADGGGEFRFFQGIHVRIDIRIDISISIRPMTNKYDKQVHLQELTQMRLIMKKKTVYLHYQNAYGHQTWQDSNVSGLAPAHKVT